MSSEQRQFSEEELARIARMAGDGCTAEIVRDFIEYEWDNLDEHWRWLNKANAAEIAGWVKSCRQGEVLPLAQDSPFSGDVPAWIENGEEEPRPAERNAKRAREAQKLLEAQRTLYDYRHEDNSTVLCDLLANLLHLCHRRADMDFDTELQQARAHLAAELEEERTGRYEWEGEA